MQGRYGIRPRAEEAKRAGSLRCSSAADEGKEEKVNKGSGRGWVDGRVAEGFHGRALLTTTTVTWGGVAGEVRTHINPAYPGEPPGEPGEAWALFPEGLATCDVPMLPCRGCVCALCCVCCAVVDRHIALSAR
jgi:hypothetical protein